MPLRKTDIMVFHYGSTFTALGDFCASIKDAVRCRQNSYVSLIFVLLYFGLYSLN